MDIIIYKFIKLISADFGIIPLFESPELNIEHIGNNIRQLIKLIHKFAEREKFPNLRGFMP